MLGVGADATKIVQGRLGLAEVAPRDQDTITAGCETERHRAPDATSATGHQRRTPAHTFARVRHDRSLGVS